MGFTGSAGLGIVTQSSAVLFVDGRYLSQAQWEVESHGISVQDISQQRPEEWLFKHMPRGETLSIPSGLN